MLYAVELTSKVTGETRSASIEADDYDRASGLATKMQADLVRRSGITWCVTINHPIRRT
jgi:hypothetical protein